MPSTPQQLVENAACISQCVPQGMQMAVLIYQFALISGSGTDPQTLMNNAKCFQDCIPDGMKQAVLIYLLDKATNG